MNGHQMKRIPGDNLELREIYYELQGEIKIGGIIIHMDCIMGSIP
jgi:hypothetical protein